MTVRRCFVRLFCSFLVLASFGLADTITFRDGHTVTGSFLGGDARSVRIAVGDRVESYSLDQLVSITFDGGTASAAPAPPRREERQDPRPDRREVKDTGGITLA